MSTDNPLPHVPERLNLWDRVFNRTRKVVHQRGADRVTTMHFDEWTGKREPDTYKTHQWVEYRVIDRLTGSVRIEREYLT